MFNDTIINGNVSGGGITFDGLDVALAGSDTEYNVADEMDLSTSDDVTENYVEFLDKLDEFILGLDGRPTALLGNTKVISKIRACARRTGSITEAVDDFGRQIITYDGIALIDLGDKPGTTDPVISVGSGGLTSLYAVRLGLDAFHGICMKDSSPIRVWLPDFDTAGAVKQGEVEMVAAVALKKQTSAGVFRNIKVQ